MKINLKNITISITVQPYAEIVKTTSFISTALSTSSQSQDLLQILSQIRITFLKVYQLSCNYILAAGLQVFHFLLLLFVYPVPAYSSFPKKCVDHLNSTGRLSFFFSPMHGETRVNEQHFCVIHSTNLTILIKIYILPSYYQH